MPRLSLFKSEKGNNYRFIDRQISQMFQVGGADVYVHKYLGSNNSTTGSATEPVYSTLDPTNIQDMLLLENRDRKYDQEIYRIRGYYNVQNLDFNISQFGMFLDNDTLYMTVHINDFIKYVGRKPLSGDVLEFPGLKDDFALNDFDISLPRYYVIEDVGRASEGFSPTWLPHLYRLRLNKITDSQQFADILNLPAGEGTNLTVGDLLSTNARDLEINDAVVAQAEIDAPYSGYETRQFYTLAVDPNTGKPIISETEPTVANVAPVRTGYTGYLVGDGFPVNGLMFGQGTQFPENPQQDDFFLRLDFLPSRLFRFDQSVWLRVEDAVRMTMTNTDTRHTQKTSFINNNNYTYNDLVERDILSLTLGQFEIETNIDFTTALFVVFKLNTVVLGYSTTDYPSMLSSYTVGSQTKLKITLPIINTVQETITESGVWNISLYNNRVAQRQSLSKALKPEANF